MLVHEIVHFFKSSNHSEGQERHQLILDAFYSNGITDITSTNLQDCEFDLSALNNYDYDSPSGFHSFIIYYDTITNGYGLMINKKAIKIIKLFIHEIYSDIVKKLSNAYMDMEMYERSLPNIWDEQLKTETLNNLANAKAKIIEIGEKINRIQTAYYSELELFKNDTQYLKYLADKCKV